jgi:probable HAF family extracellular repeat protein
MSALGFDGVADKVNNRTEIVGQISSSAHAFLWKDGNTLDLGTLGNGGVSLATGINNRGEVVGQASGPTSAHAFAWTRIGGMRDLGSLDGPGSASGANAINDQGQIVGGSYSQGAGTTHAVYFNGPNVIDLGTLGGLSDASAVNTLGQVVGDSYTSDGDHAFITDLDGGPMVDLNTLIPPDSGWIRLFSAQGINDAGQIVGSGQLPGYDVIHAYLLTPVDSPAAAVITIAPEPRAVRTAVTAMPFAEDKSVDLRSLPQPVDARGDSPPPCPASFVPRSVTVLAPWAGQATAQDQWYALTADVLAQNNSEPGPA